MTEFHISLICYCWVLFLVLRLGRKNMPKLDFIPALTVAVTLTIIFYLPLIAIWALRTFFMLT